VPPARCFTVPAIAGSMLHRAGRAHRGRPAFAVRDGPRGVNHHHPAARQAWTERARAARHARRRSARPAPQASAPAGDRTGKRGHRQARAPASEGTGRRGHRQARAPAGEGTGRRGHRQARAPAGEGTGKRGHRQARTPASEDTGRRGHRQARAPAAGFTPQDTSLRILPVCRRSFASALAVFGGGLGWVVDEQAAAERRERVADPSAAPFGLDQGSAA